jgi:hypothetical protein
MPVRGHEGPKGCEMSRLPHFLLDIQFTDGGTVVSYVLAALYPSQEDAWYSFLLEAQSTPGP